MLRSCLSSKKASNRVTVSSRSRRSSRPGQSGRGQEAARAASPVEGCVVRRRRRQARRDPGADRRHQRERRSRRRAAELEAREAQVQAERVRNEFANTAQRMVEKFPVLHAETGDPEAIKKVVALRDYYINADNLSAGCCAGKGVDRNRRVFTRAALLAPMTRAPRISAGLRPLSAAREATDQPPPTAQAGVGARAQALRLNPEKMSEREFNALPEEERARLRGDIV